MSLISRRGAPQTGTSSSDTARDEEIDLDLVEESLMQLTMPVPYTRDEDISIRMRHHNSRGETHFTRLFRKIAHTVVCYSEHHHDE
jgi:phenolic acid decarboxylase